MHDWIAIKTVLLVYIYIRLYNLGLYNMELKSKKITLDDKYTLEEGRVYITGTQALVRLPIIQRQKDKSQNLNKPLYQQ